MLSGLLDRHEERELLDRLIAAIRGGESRALVVLGEPGVGKTELLEYVVGRAAGCRVARAVGVQSEMELAFAGLHQLCAPMLDRLDRLPPPQRDALCIAFGLSGGQAPDRFLVGLAVLSLLAEEAQEQPLICVVDDAQWLDRASEQTLAFVSRRLFAESIALIFAARSPDEVTELTDLERLVVTGLPDDAARKLLSAGFVGPLDEQMRDRIIAETRGNPLALLELPKGLTPAKLAGGFGLPGVGELPGQIEDCYRQRVEALPSETQRLLLVAAAEPLGDPVLVWRAAETLGVHAGAVAPAATAGLLKIDVQVRFHHPLVRSAIYRAASPDDRRSAHRALARVTDPEADPDRRAWHAAQATSGPDEDVAAELERSAGRAQARSGLAAAAAFLERATGLTVDPARRVERALAAAQLTREAGAPDAALKLLSLAEAGPLDKLQSAKVDLIRAQVAFTMNRGSDAPPLLLKAAKRLESLDVGLARETYRDAFAAALFAGRLARDGNLLEVAKATRVTLPPARPPRPPDVLLEGLALLITDGYPAGAPVVKRALRGFHGQDISAEEALRWLWLACRTAHDMWDFEAWRLLADRQVQLARDAGALSVLPLAFSMRVGVHLFAGEIAEAALLVEEVESVGKAMGIELLPYNALALAAWRGRETEVSRLMEATTREAVSRGEGHWLTAIHWATAVLCNGLGRYNDALTAAMQADEYPQEMAISMWALPELIEASSRCGQADRATDPLRRLATATRAGGSDWGLGVEAQSRALLSEGPAAEGLYLEAIERFSRSGIRASLGRAHLLYGEWLRRERRRLDAREQLRTAHDMLATMGIDAFAQRATRELLATGETTRRRTVESSDELTAQEAQIVRLVREGLSNSEIGSRLFISPRTVEWHLSKIFSKLRISSRRQLKR